MTLLKTLRSQAKRDTVAAVDLGSNSFHMVVARNQHGRLQVVDRLKDMVRLAAGLTDDGGLEPEAQERALACLQRFGQRVRDLPRGSVRAVGTNTLRQASRSQHFLVEAEAALGHPIEIVSGVEEARLVYLGVANSVPEDGQRRLVVDIGGGSTELIVGERTEARLMESLHMGCVNMTARFLANGSMDKSTARRLEEAVLMELEPVQAQYRASGWQHAVGASGTIKAVQAVVQGQGWSDQGISRAALDKLRQAVLTAANVKRLRFPG
ncbi:MAG: Ppx/GppA family phosphatase, partial [Ectothiorhodospiraceae bacterium]|nr:Ppx/GppA family phosphatase [Ectothiorhodospiraceae bacterium]